jgi:hypothetical protein
MFQKATAKKIPFFEISHMHKFYTIMLAKLIAAFQLNLVLESARGNKLSYVKHDGSDGGSLYSDIKVESYGTIELKNAGELSRRCAFKAKWQAVSQLVVNRQVLGKEKSTICSGLDDGFNTWTFLSIQNALYYFPRKHKLVEYLLMTLLRWLMVLPGRNLNFETIIGTILQEGVSLTGASFEDRLCRDDSVFNDSQPITSTSTTMTMTGAKRGIGDIDLGDTRQLIDAGDNDDDDDSIDDEKLNEILFITRWDHERRGVPYLDKEFLEQMNQGYSNGDDKSEDGSDPDSHRSFKRVKEWKDKCQHAKASMSPEQLDETSKKTNLCR